MCVPSCCQRALLWVLVPILRMREVRQGGGMICPECKAEMPPSPYPDFPALRCKAGAERWLDERGLDWRPKPPKA